MEFCTALDYLLTKVIDYVHNDDCMLAYGAVTAILRDFEASCLPSVEM